MKILHIDTELTWRGGENQVRLLIESARSPDWEWHLAARPGSQAIARMQPFAKVLALPMKGLQQISAARKIAAYCREEGIDVMDCQSSRAHQIGLLAKFFAPEVALVVHRRVDYKPGSSAMNRYKYLNERISRYVAISAAIGRILETYGVPKDKISVVRSAVDPGPFQGQDKAKARAELSAELKIPEGRPIIGNVAYITEQKGHETLVRALGILKKQGVPFFCFIAGDGDLRPKNELIAAEIGLGPEDLRFLGIRKDVPHLLAASDIFAMSSNDEGLGTSLLDAVHSSCTLVSTEVGGIPEIVMHEKTGLISPARDPGAFAANLRRVIENPDFSLSLRTTAKTWVDDAFSLKAMVEGNLAVYRSLAKKQK